MLSSRRNWFDDGGNAYARFRPDYPAALSLFLAQSSPSLDAALDVGCGNGQLTRQLAAHFVGVFGVDRSADQIAHALPHERVEYRVAAAENLGEFNRRFSLITAAQAAHWFDLPRFYEEVRRVSAPGAILALLSYGVPVLDAALNERFLTFYQQEIGPYWPPERRLVDAGYRELPFPFSERTPPVMTIEREWDIDAFLGYILTWSSVRRSRDVPSQDAMLMRFESDLRSLWGRDGERRTVAWPVNIRVGEVS
jgi:SAM-dependent methyltransferase